MLRTMVPPCRARPPYAAPLAGAAIAPRFAMTAAKVQIGDPRRCWRLASNRLMYGRGCMLMLLLLRPRASHKFPRNGGPGREPNAASLCRMPSLAHAQTPDDRQPGQQLRTAPEH